MAKKFENKKLNKKDHAKVDKDAAVAKKVVMVMGAALVGFLSKMFLERNSVER